MTIKETYPYTDESGKLLYEVVRYEPKSFRQRRPDGNGGWIDGLGDTARVLYNLPAVISAKEVALNCGEKDAATAMALGLVATTNSGGETVPWIDPNGSRPDWVLALSGKHVLFFPDTDGPGRIHCENVVLALKGIVASLAVIWVPVGKDFTDYINSGATSADLNKLIEIAKLPENSPVAKMQRLVRRKANLTAIESEKLVLGSVMAGRSPFSEIDHLATQDFSIDPHKQIFDALKTLDQKGTTDRAAVVQCLEEREQLEKCGGLSGLLDMTEDLPTAYNVENHAEIIQKRSSDRKLLKDLCSGAEDMIVGGDTEEIRQKIVKSINENSGVGQAVEIRGADKIVGVSVEEFWKPKPMGIMVKPLAPLFEMFRGMRPGQLIVLAARPADGKSCTATLIAAYSAQQGYQTDFISLEVGDDDALRKMACMAAKVPYLNAITGHVSPKQRERLYHTTEQLKKLPLRLDSKTNWTVSKIRTYLRKRQASGNPSRLLILDYLQLLGSSGNHQNRNLEVGSITRGLKLMALEFGMTIIVLSQLSRDGVKAGRKPILSDLRESGSIEQDADIVIFSWQDWANDQESEYERNAELILAKQRDGPVGSFKVKFAKPFGQMFCPGTINPLDYSSLLG